MRRLATVKRLDQRLHDRDSAVVRTRVAPRFEIVSGGHVPVTHLRSFVFVLAEVNAHHVRMLFKPVSKSSFRSAGVL